MRVCAWIMGALFYSTTIGAIPSVVPDRIPCFVELETGFFSEPIVNQALSLYNVRQELWVPINQLLQQKSLGVPKRMQDRTAYMVPNPIEYPMQRGATAKILKQVLFEVLDEVIRQYHTAEIPSEIPNTKLIFEYIFSRQFPAFLKCFGPEVMELKPKNLI
jgi:hypothetical protein